MNSLFKNFQTNKKRILLFGGIAFLILIIIIVLIILLLTVFKKYDYAKIESMMVQETQNYLRNNQELAPTAENPEVTIEASTLVNEKYLKDLNKLSKDSNCTGTIKVSYNEETLRYTPNLTCANYSSTTLINHIFEYEELKETDNGLYNLNDFYTYRGERVNNYLAFANETWRIIKFNDEQIDLILADTANEMEPIVFDDRYNETIETNRGYNNFANSRIEDSLLDIYNDFFKNYHAYLLNTERCTHTRSETDWDNTGAIECYTTYESTISLLPVYDYINASLDPLCKTSVAGNCANYNYLTKTKNRFWLLNGTNENTYEVYTTSNRGTLILDNASSKRYIRVVISLPTDVLYAGGSGTSENPYTIYTY